MTWQNRPTLGRAAINPYTSTTFVMEIRWSEVTPAGSFQSTSISFTGVSTYSISVNSDRRSASVTLNIPTNTLGSVVTTIPANAIKRTGTGYGPDSAISFPALYYDTRPALEAFWQNVPARGDRQACPFTLHILFSEQVSGLALSDFTWSGPATPSAPAVVTAGREWSIGITPSIGANAAFTISLNADSVTRASGGTGPPTAVAARPIHIDTRVEPMITWTEPTGVQDRNFSVRIDFGQAITGFASDDVEVVVTTQTANAQVISINAVTSVTPAGRQYLIVVRPQRNANGT